MMDACVLQSLSCVRRQLPEGPFMLLTQLHESTITDAMISEASRFGVRGCIPGSASVEIALAALRLVIAGGTYFPRSVVMDSEELPDWTLISPERTVVTQSAITMNGVPAQVSDSPQRSCVAFTERERQVVANLQRGLSNKIIAHELHLSQNTVKTHISRIMRKLEVSNRTEAALAVQRNLTSADD
jgi:DNA-binding NarL/FixJ family response regulator